MIKFFRKYNKQLLVIITILTIVVFTGGTALSHLFSPGPEQIKLAKAFDRAISRADFNQVQYETSILDNLARHTFAPLRWNQPWAEGYSRDPMALTRLDYLLLIREALAQGARPDLAQAQEYLNTLNLDLLKFRIENEYASEQVEQAVANFLMVRNQWLLASQSAVPGELEVQKEVQNQLETIDATVLALDSQPLIDESESISEETLLAHFEKYKEQTPTNNPLDFGYLLPDRVKVQYIKIATSDIQYITEITESQAREYWMKHQQDFKKPQPDTETPESDNEAEDAEEPEPQPAPDDQPENTTKNDIPETEPNESAKKDETIDYYETFAEAQPDVIKFLEDQGRKHYQLETARAMANTIQQELNAAWTGAKEGDDGFLQAPEPVQQLSHYPQVFESLKDELAAPKAISIVETPWFGLEDAYTIDDIGKGEEDLPDAPSRRSFGMIPHWVQGLVNLEEADNSIRYRFLALWQTYATRLIDEDNNLYLFRVTASEKSHAPASLDEVRDKVLAHVRAQRAFDLAKQKAEEISQQAIDGDIRTVWENYGGLGEADMKPQVGSVFDVTPFSRSAFVVIDQNGNLDNMIRSYDFARQAWEMAESSGDQAMGVVAVSELQKVFLVKLGGINPVDREKFDLQKQRLSWTMQKQRERQLLMDYFDPDRIRVRTHYAEIKEKETEGKSAQAKSK